MGDLLSLKTGELIAEFWHQSKLYLELSTSNSEFLKPVAEEAKKDFLSPKDIENSE